MSDMAARFGEIVGEHNLLTGDAMPEDYWHDEVLTTGPQQPAYVAKPATAEEVAATTTLNWAPRVPPGPATDRARP